MRIVFNLMNHLNPLSGGMNTIISIMHHLKENNFHVGIYYFSYEEQKSIHLGLENHFQLLGFEDLDPENDVVVVAEEFIWVAYDFLIPRGIKYIIFNQGLSASLFSHNPYNEQKYCYHNALCILVNSLHTANGVKKLFDVSNDNIFMYRIGVDTKMYYPEPKEKMACCLEYKNGTFVKFIAHYFKDRYPDWTLKLINMRPRDETAAIFRKSKLFLSFGGPEGFGLPPLEAAFSGCRVVGFHGGGGEEYFKEPIFTSVNFMDHVDYIEKLNMVMDSIDDPILNEYNSYLDYLKYFYNTEFSKMSIVNFFVHIRDNFFR